MALHGSAVANLSPILFKGNNRSLGVNVIIHQDISISMDDVSSFYSDGTFIGTLQDSLLAQGIGTDVDRYPNIYAYFGQYSRNPKNLFTISNPNGTININQGFMRGENSGASTISKWTGSNYFTNKTPHVVNVCTNVIGKTTNAGRLLGNYVASPAGSWISEDVHGSLWSIWTTPNAISTGTAGRYGSVIGSGAREGSTTVIITNSDEQNSAPGDMINELVDVGPVVQSYSNGLLGYRYKGYFSIDATPRKGGTATADNVNYDQTATLDDTSIPGYPNPMTLTSINRFFEGPSLQSDRSATSSKTWVINGYFKPQVSGVHTFRLTSDDASYLWINRTSGYTRNNATINNGGPHAEQSVESTVNLTAGVYYPLRIIYGNIWLNPTMLSLEFKQPGSSTFTTNGSGYYYQLNSTYPQRSINGDNSELDFRKYRVFALSTYSSTDGYDGVLFYGSGDNPYGYIKFTGASTYTLTRSSTAPSWQKSGNQEQDTLTLASETRGGLFKINNVFTNTGNDYRTAFSNALASFIADTV